MKLTWKSKTLLEVRWPWMSKRNHEESVYLLKNRLDIQDAAIASNDELRELHRLRINELTLNHNQLISSLKKSHTKEVRDLSKRLQAELDRNPVYGNGET